MQKKCGKLSGSMPKIRSTRGKTVSTPSHPWRERPGQSGHYRSSITRCNGNEVSIHMKPAPLLWVGSDSFLVRDPELCSQHLFLLPSRSLPVSSLALVALKGGHKGRFFCLSELTSTVKIWERFTLKPVRELSVKNWAAHRCLLQPPSIPSTLTYCHDQNTKHNRFATRRICFIQTKLLVYLVGGGGDAIRFFTTKFFKTFLETIAF